MRGDEAIAMIYGGVDEERGEEDVDVSKRGEYRG